MGNFFPRWTNILPLKVAFAFLILVSGVTAAITYYWTPKYSRVGYQPQQPIPFKHTIHAGQLGMDCRYCHSNVERSTHANVPNAQTCWSCHMTIRRDSPQLAPLRAAMDKTYEGYTGEPIQWVRVHKVPEFAYFNHQVHVNRGVSCVSCHGKITEMEEVYHHEPQSMSWCLDCHRAPENKLRPLDQITNLNWQASDTDRVAFYDYLAKLTGKPADALQSEAAKEYHLNPKGPLTQTEVGLQLKNAWDVRPPESCAACHR